MVDNNNNTFEELDPAHICSTELPAGARMGRRLRCKVCGKTYQRGFFGWSLEKNDEDKEDGANDVGKSKAVKIETLVKLRNKYMGAVDDLQGENYNGGRLAVLNVRIDLLDELIEQAS